jgi:hypothetical protein
MGSPDAAVLVRRAISHGRQGPATATPVHPDRQASRLYRRSRSTSQADSASSIPVTRSTVMSPDIEDT